MIANSAAQVRSAGVRPASRATTATKSPHAITPRYSAWARNECTVARTSPTVSWFTTIVPSVRVSGTVIPATSSTAALALTSSGALASTTSPTAPAAHATA